MISQAFSPTAATWQPESNVYGFSRSPTEVLGNSGLVHGFFSFFSLCFSLCFLFFFAAILCTLVQSGKQMESTTFCNKSQQNHNCGASRSVNYVKNIFFLGGGDVLLMATLFKFIFTSKHPPGLPVYLLSLPMIFPAESYLLFTEF